MQKKGKSYRIYILNLFALLITATVAVVVINFYKHYTDSLLELSDQTISEVTQKVILSTEAFLEPASTHVELTAQFISDLDTPDIIRNQNLLLKMMWNQVSKHKQLLSVYLADENGSFVQSTLDPAPATRVIDRSRRKAKETWIYRNAEYKKQSKKVIAPDYDPRVRSWYKNTKSDLKAYWSDVYLFARTKQLGITVSYPVINKRTKKIISIVASDISLKELSDFLTKQKISENSIVMIINNEGEIVAYPGTLKKYTKRLNADINEPLKIEELKIDWLTDGYKNHHEVKKNKVTTETNKKTYISVFTPFPKSFGKDWSIAIIIPEDDILGSMYEALYSTIKISIVVLLFALLIVMYISFQFSKPILAMAKETELIKDFHLDKVKGVDSFFHEIILLNEAFMGMVNGLKAFRKFVPSDLVRDLIHSGKTVDIGGEKTNLTVFFSDVENFTMISEKIPAEELMVHLSEYFEELSKIIKTNNGTIDKFIGDAIMAFWGAPIALQNSAYLACKAACRCQNHLNALNERWEKEGQQVMKTRIGINTGEMIVGNLGSESRLNYTVVGDAVNLGARLEELNKIYGTSILIGEDTYN